MKLRKRKNCDQNILYEKIYFNSKNKIYQAIGQKKKRHTQKRSISIRWGNF